MKTESKREIAKALIRNYDPEILKIELEESIADELTERNHDHLKKMKLEDRSIIRLRIRVLSHKIFNSLKDVSRELLEESIDLLISSALREIEKQIKK